METTNIFNVFSVSFLAQFIHPLLMLGLFAYLLYTAYLGIQVRRTRQANGETKKVLAQGKYSTRHHQSGALLLAAVAAGALGGIVSTYFSAGEIPAITHLFVGLGMTALVAISAALVPLMQRGQDWARQVHLLMNIGLLILYTWQTITGLQIVQELLAPSLS